jgi:hypothetical protein
MAPLPLPIGDVRVPIMVDEVGTGDSGATVVSRATTAGQALPLGVDDPVIASRAVRRALAEARWHASDVDAMVVATPPPLTLDAVGRFARRALGPHGATVRCEARPAGEEGGERLAGLALRIAPGGAARWMAVGIGRDGQTVALCVIAAADAA